MSNEIHINADIKVTKGSVNRSKTIRSLKRDMAGKAVMQNVQLIGFADVEDILLGDIATPGYVFLENVDDTNFIRVGPFSGSFSSLMKLNPGDIAIFPMDSAAELVAIADTAEAELDVMIVEA